MTQEEVKGEQKIREELQGTEEFEKVQLVDKPKPESVSSRKFDRQVSSGSWKDAAARAGEEEEEGGGYEEDEDGAGAEWEWDYGDPWEEKQHIVFRSKSKSQSQDNLTEENTENSPAELVSVKFLSEEDIVEGEDPGVSRSPSIRSSISLNSEDSGAGTGASSDGDVEDNDSEDDQRWVMSKNLINNLTKLDSMMKTEGNLEPRLVSLCDSMSSLKLEEGSCVSPRQRMTAEWTARSLKSLAPRHQAQPGECSVYTCLTCFSPDLIRSVPFLLLVLSCMKSVQYLICLCCSGPVNPVQRARSRTTPTPVLGTKPPSTPLPASSSSSSVPLPS